MLGPDNAVNRLRWCVADGATWICLLRSFRSAFIALSVSFLNQFHLTTVSSSSTFYQWNLGCEAHPIDVVSGGSIVQGVKHDVELLVECDAVIGSGRNTII